MRKVFIVLLILIAVVSLAACAKEADTDSTTPASESEAVTEIPAEKPTQKPTDPPTEAPTAPSYTVITQSSGETAELNGDGTFTYTNRKYGWSVDIPEVWNEYGMIIEYDDTGKTEFKHESSFFSDYHLTGDIFSMMTVPASEYKESEFNIKLYGDDEYVVFWSKPSDVQTDLHKEDELEPLKESREQILESFRWE